MQVRVVADDCRAEAVERIETPAGAFDALRIVLRTTTYVTGMPPRAMVMTQWVARGVGLVRQGDSPARAGDEPRAGTDRDS